ncbi:MAG: hypothetical protein QME63_02740 [Actinomycetota bacterium]|nr:hypothetical protein [Actinomycetota bacterium]
MQLDAVDVTVGSLVIRWHYLLKDSIFIYDIPSIVFFLSVSHANM